MPHPSFRVIVTASKSLPLKDWLTDEHSNMFFPIATIPMSQHEEASILLQTGCPRKFVDVLLAFADKYRSSMTSDAVQKNRKLGTRALVRIASRLGRYPGYADLHSLLSRSVLAEFLPKTERLNLENIFEELGIKKLTPPVRFFCSSKSTVLMRPSQFNPSPAVLNNRLRFPTPSGSSASKMPPVVIPCFEASADVEGAASHVPYMDHFYDNSIQTAIMRDIAIDLEVLGEHLVLHGNQVEFVLSVAHAWGLTS